MTGILFRPMLPGRDAAWCGGHLPDFSFLDGVVKGEGSLTLHLLSDPAQLHFSFLRTGRAR